jgi:putative tryptophan/tyrosine transport system substrate-binding protein
MKRREFITLLGGVTAAWPLVAHAQQGQRVRRIGILTALDEAENKIRIDPLLQELPRLGWSDGRNIRIDMRAAGGNAETLRKYATELLELAPDVLVAFGTAPTDLLLQATRTTPIVFTIVVDPLGSGFVNNLARPGGNVTGFTTFEYSLSGKWLDLLKQIAPDIRRVAVIRDPSIASGTGQFAVIQGVAPALGLEVTVINIRDRAEMERAVSAFAGSPNGGLVVTAGPLSTLHHNLIITLAGRHKLPSVYPFRFFATAGGLISYGPNFDDQLRNTAGYVDRILKGEKPGDMPVQAPTKYELVINLKTTKTLGLTVPPSVLARADEVIE